MSPGYPPSSSSSSTDTFLLLRIRQLSTCFLLILITTIFPVWVNSGVPCTQDKECVKLQYCPVNMCEKCPTTGSNNTKCKDETEEAIGALVIVGITAGVMVFFVIVVVCVILCCLCCVGCPGHNRRMARGGGVGYGGGGGGWARPNATDTAAAPPGFSQLGSEAQNLDSGASDGAGTGAGADSGAGNET